MIAFYDLSTYLFLKFLSGRNNNLFVYIVSSYYLAWIKSRNYFIIFATEREKPVQFFI